MKPIKTLKSITALFWVVILCLLILSAVLEKFYGTSFIHHHVYGAPWFVALWGVATLVSIAYMWCCKLQKQPVKWIMHLSLMIILLGGLVTYLVAERGTVELHQADATSIYSNEEGQIGRAHV